LDIVEHLQQRQHDSDEEVRMDVVQAVVGAARRSLANVPGELLDSVRERTLDKKVCPVYWLSWFIMALFNILFICPENIALTGHNSVNFQNMRNPKYRFCM